MREKPMRAFEDFRAKSVGGRSIRKRLARSSSIASAPIIASITVAKAAIHSRERQTLSRSQREQPLSRTGNRIQRLMLKKTVANRQWRRLSQRFFRRILQGGQIRTILCALRTIPCARTRGRRTADKFIAAVNWRECREAIFTLLLMLTATLAVGTLESASANPHRRPASRTSSWCMAHSPTAPAGKPSPRSSRRMDTRYRWRSPPRPPTPTTKSTRRPRSTPWAGRWFWWATVMAGPSSPRPAIIQTLRRLSILPHLRSMMVRAVRRSNRPCRKPPRRSSRTATATGG